ncbi:MAG: ferredoxin reductase family protein [Candidatus Fermentibacteraceae bacterium]|nr:ferredoxin reductase family protein [Candidatus Fermentibacteraceae bacterium]MBN2609324.1 ferredoxin reductase family protein [Candidatus Fermentibacteraceae bacterium]
MDILMTGSGRHRTAMTWRVLLYLLLVTAPLAVRGLFGNSSGFDITTGIGLVLGLTGFAVLALQPVLSARFRWIERPFGLDRMLRMHRVTGAVGVLFVIVHPVLLALGRGSSRLLVSLDLPWFLLAAKATLALLVLFGAAALLRSRLRIPFQLWFRCHSWLTPVILCGVFLHSYMAAVRFQPVEMRILWFGLLGTGVFSHLHLALWRRLGGRLRPWKVGSVTGITHDVWDIQLVPPVGREVFEYLPGQFLFVTLLRGRGLPREEHPFTISSSPSAKGSISITPKESGDYTRTTGKTMKGDRAAVMAPYGRFSHLLRPLSDRLVFIAGGIGITPMMSMLRHMRDSGSEQKVLLLYANRTESDIAFLDELESMASGEGGPMLEIVHVLSRPDPSWGGETGYLDRVRLERLVGDPEGSEFYVCGPPPMMKIAEKSLKDMGAGKDRIHVERFSL